MVEQPKEERNEQMSMEQILSSIRQIIVDEKDSKNNPSLMASSQSTSIPALAPEEEDVFELKDPLSEDAVPNDVDSLGVFELGESLELKEPLNEFSLDSSLTESLGSLVSEGFQDPLPLVEEVQPQFTQESSEETPLVVEPEPEELVVSQEEKSEPKSVEIPEATPVFTLTPETPGEPKDTPSEETGDPVFNFNFEEQTSHLLSQTGLTASQEAFALLSKAVTLSRTAIENQDIRARTVDELMKEIMRPYIKDWLDKSLPGLVERLVAQEIARIAKITPTYTAP
jgi:cell pole-organizing protein PopZ